ncbi:MAG: 3-hydroxyacyl-ACP dehydratase [Bacteroidetes bacterium]|nr:3-hydroxyacyl-ACP dehydratase [Bacteroidota bacterium]
MTTTFLLNDFYTVMSAKKTENGVLLATIVLNVNHPIFKGHFEQMPVVPGVCQTQLIKELLQEETGKNLTLSIGNNIKFTGMIIPTTHPTVQVELNYTEANEQYIVDAQLFFENTIFTKFKGTFSQN